MNTTNLTQLEFTDEDLEKAEDIARSLGYAQQAYTSTSALIGLYCLAEREDHPTGPYREGCIIKTKELGFMFVQLLEDLKIGIEN